MIKIQTAARFGLLALVVALAGCGAVSNAPTPSPLPVIQAKVATHVLWRASVGGATDYRFLPARLNDDTLAVAGARNSLALIKLADGSKVWEITLDHPISGGVGAGSGLIAVGTLKGELLTFGADGKPRWHVSLPSEIIAPPTIAEDTVMVRTGDGRITGLAVDDGKRVWQFQRQLPALTLRNFAPLSVTEGTAVAGLAGGRLAALGVIDGRVLWDSPVSLPHGATELERISDIVAAPAIEGQTVCAATYQGRVGCFNVLNGSLLWSREASSFSGVALDNERVYMVAADGGVQAYDRSGGRSLWRQDKLVARAVSSPVVVDGYVAVGDYQGYVHVLQPDDGMLVGQIATDGSRIAAAPQVMDDKLIVQTQAGSIYALKVK